jgi:hypothetical protein
MTVTIDTKTLNVEGGGIEESIEVVGSFVDKWQDEAYRKEAKIFGTVRSWTLRCYENNVAWSSSNAKYLQDKAKEGNKLSFSVDEGNLHAVTSTYVYILGVDVDYPKGSKATQFTRFFTLKLQEAPS